jgi:hypothetical protein
MKIDDQDAGFFFGVLPFIGNSGPEIRINRSATVLMQ